MRPSGNWEVVPYYRGRLHLQVYNVKPLIPFPHNFSNRLIPFGGGDASCLACTTFGVEASTVGGEGANWLFDLEMLDAVKDLVRAGAAAEIGEEGDSCGWLRLTVVVRFPRSEGETNFRSMLALVREVILLGRELVENFSNTSDSASRSSSC